MRLYFYGREEKADGSQMVKRLTAGLFKVRNHYGPREDQKTHTYTCGGKNYTGQSEQGR